jgi:hypothetical protein
MKNQSMFPFRRNGPKKRGKGGGGGGRRPHDNGGGRRVPGSAAELLPMLQPSTKALAQMLAGNTKMSGQLAHARGVLAQANRIVDERLADRLPPAARELFFEQLALLKLTIADAEEAGLAAEALADEPVKPKVVVDAERLREVALRLATAEPAPQVPLAAVHTEPHEDAEAHQHDDQHSGYAPSRGRGDSGQQEAEPAVGTGPRRERLRLKSVQRAAPEADG